MPPVISMLNPGRNITVRKGSTVKLVCNATGSPKPEIVWERQVCFHIYISVNGNQFSLCLSSNTITINSNVVSRRNNLFYCFCMKYFDYKDYMKK